MNDIPCRRRNLDFVCRFSSDKARGICRNNTENEVLSIISLVLVTLGILILFFSVFIIYLILHQKKTYEKEKDILLTQK